ncbi:MAG: hypothetical protein KOO62_07630 [candidate division Zixibacteria bacterium]|nr:hypothetical protein [candidate division Zixibacteria bacterium]
MHRNVVIALLILTSCLWLGCAVEPEPTATIQELHQLVTSGADPFVLDVRSEGEFLSRRMAFVDVRISVDSLEAQSNLLPTDKSVAIYCVGYAEEQSKQAVKTLVALGYTRALYVVGGLKAWAEASFETTGGEL